MAPGSKMLLLVLALGLTSALALAAPAAVPDLACPLENPPAGCAYAAGVSTLAVSADAQPAIAGKQFFLTGEWSADIKLPAGNTGGVAWAFYLLAPGDNPYATNPVNNAPGHQEIDIELYGNATAATVVMITDVHADGEHYHAEYTLPFDPSLKAHTYAMRWNAKQLVWLVDGYPIHVINKVAGKPWPNKAMYPLAAGFTTPWTALQATFENGPLAATFSNYKVNGCPAAQGDLLKPAAPLQCAGPWNAVLTPAQTKISQLLKAKHLKIDYGWEAE